MGESWRQYQEQAAAYFRKLGLQATVECKVSGVRCSHDVDVLVQGTFHGICFRWGRGMQAWKTNIPKEKVLALYSIIQDVGADRGFLLSESGFQSGALRAVENTNITLSSLEDLAAVTEPHLRNSALGALFWRSRKQIERLYAVLDEEFYGNCSPPSAEPGGKMMLLDMALGAPYQGKLPTVLVDEFGN